MQKKPRKRGFRKKSEETSAFEMVLFKKGYLIEGQIVRHLIRSKKKFNSRRFAKPLTFEGMRLLPQGKFGERSTGRKLLVGQTVRTSDKIHAANACAFGHRYAM